MGAFIEYTPEVFKGLLKSSISLGKYAQGIYERSKTLNKGLENIYGLYLFFDLGLPILNISEPTIDYSCAISEGNEKSLKLLIGIPFFLIYATESPPNGTLFLLLGDM
ncbi:MAG TPA: hypothetical protein PK507_00805 [bacterium]|jgi:hypothetical protein|nr:hypothetical protein [bacterium]